MKKDYYKFYINIEEFDELQIKVFWNYMFSITDTFSFRFPNNYKSKNEYNEYLNNNIDLINNCNKSIVKNYESNHYFGNTYGGNPSHIYLCRLTTFIKRYIINHSNLYLWEEPDFPEDLCLLEDNRIVLYSCSHEFEINLYLDQTQINHLPPIIKANINNGICYKYQENELPKI